MKLIDKIIIVENKNIDFKAFENEKIFTWYRSKSNENQISILDNIDENTKYYRSKFLYL